MRSNGSDYSIFEYDYSTGVLLHTDGGLFDKLKIVAPPTLSEFKIDVHSWPFAKTDRYSFTRDICEFLDDELDDSKTQFSTQFALIVDGIKHWISVFTINIRDTGTLTKALVFALIDDYKSNIDEFVQSSERDSLTGVLNRDSLKSVVDKMLLEDTYHVAFLFDIDSFKSLNDTYGHAYGDKMLADIIKHVLSGLGKDDQIGRIGGDEFFILFKNRAARDKIEYFANNLRTAVKRALPNGMIVSVSMGIVISPEDGKNFDELYTNADKALSFVKDSGGDALCFYNDIKNNIDYYDISEMKSSVNMVPDNDYLIKYYYGDSSDKKYHHGDYILSDSFRENFNLEGVKNLGLKLRETDLISEVDLDNTVNQIDKLIFDPNRNAAFFQYRLRTKSGVSRWYNICVSKEKQEHCLYIVIADVHDFVINYNKLKKLVDFDELTNLHTKRNFVDNVDEIIKSEASDIKFGKYALIYFDVSKFKMINDIFGLERGDELLKYLADSIKKVAKNEFHACRIGSDRFAIFIKANYSEINTFINDYLNKIEEYPITMKVVCNFGVYITDGEVDSAELMIDRAAIAQANIKGSVVDKISFYTDYLRKNLVNEHFITSDMQRALDNKEFQVYYQPQFNHATGQLVGAEALVRWLHPDKGLVTPKEFIPIFEKNGFITHLDLFVLEEVVRLLRQMIDDGIKVVPISVNLSRYDIFRSNLIDSIERIRNQYDIDTGLIRLEITESTMSDEDTYAKKVIDELHKRGYTIEMDDFGTGFSSLNVLKNIQMDVLKLDMEFIRDSSKSNRAGAILRSIIRMATWLKMPVIAEGVETQDQADYLKSIGCNIIQGYFYSKPVEMETFKKIVLSSDKVNVMKTFADESMNNFWTPGSLEDAMFNRFVGPAAVICYSNGTIELLRMNDKFMKEIGNDITERDLMRTSPDFCMDKEDYDSYLEACKKATETNEEVVVETWRNYGDSDETKICLRSTITCIEDEGDGYILYCLVENITDERKATDELKRTDEMFEVLCESADIFMWEYDIDNDILYPCRRCKKRFNVPDKIVDFRNNNLNVSLFGIHDKDKLNTLHETLKNGSDSVVDFITLEEDKTTYTVRYELNNKPNKSGRIASASAVRYLKAKD